MSGTWVQTRSRRNVNLLDPLPSQINITDICHGLALTYRYRGATEFPWSVAQHSLLVLQITRRLSSDPMVHLWALMHDFHEAYLGDLPAPLICAINETVEYCANPVAQISEGLDDAILRAFGLPRPTAHARQIVRRADWMAASTECMELMSGPVDDWGRKLEPVEDIDLMYVPWSVMERELQLKFLELRQLTRTEEYAG